MVRDANYWECSETSSRPRKSIVSKATVSKKTKKKNIEAYNKVMRSYAVDNADDLRENPSELEKRMIDFLDYHSIIYDFQRIFYIKDKNGKVKRFYIADFYIPSKNLIIETDGAFHDKQVKQDEIRTKSIQHHYPNIKVIRWRWRDFQSIRKIKELKDILGKN